MNETWNPSKPSVEPRGPDDLDNRLIMADSYPSSLAPTANSYKRARGVICCTTHLTDSCKFMAASGVFSTVHFRQHHHDDLPHYQSMHSPLRNTPRLLNHHLMVSRW
ncbi:hypothetical protein PGT21_023901 [Puccinia graminis f. sp. tritici]|uniref:Uncharacterized protein n=1 Tax=Puccinia graminis f. sp. tritici TaxID=56615 RepID=A0A5B0RGD9_PUCGR|nr:hypothetical protein PGT21_023901 [Puccinia graminis f. sp. tritici]KAA1124015.1 hypothetical protein PGTUg99_020156 [Puccinia graminis f. sp. tritici]